MDAADERLFLVRGMYQLAITSLDDALSSFENVLAKKPTNLVALMGKVSQTWNSITSRLDAVTGPRSLR